jgi:hypothetical protein
VIEVTDMQEFRRFTCDGGPHIVLPASARGLWHGVGENYDPLDETTDYARACAVVPPAGLISVGQEQALVLAGSPPMTAWNTSLSDGVLNLYVLESWSTSDIDSLLRSASDDLPTAQLRDTGMRWRVTDDLIVMFAGDRGGATTYGESTLPRLSGQHAIYTGRYEGKLGALLFIRLEPQAD